LVIFHLGPIYLDGPQNCMTKLYTKLGENKSFYISDMLLSFKTRIAQVQLVSI